MPNWIGFSTALKWSKDNAGATDCSAKCAICEKEWKDLVKEGRGDEAVHMIELKPDERTPCGLPYKFICHQDYLTESIL